MLPKEPEGGIAMLLVSKIGMFELTAVVEIPEASSGDSVPAGFPEGFEVLAVC